MPGEESRLLLRRFQELDDSALFLAGDVGTETHVMNNHVPLRVSIHGGRSNVMAAQTIIRPQLLARETHVGIARACVARFAYGFRFRACKEIHARADQEQEQGDPGSALQHSNHIVPC